MLESPEFKAKNQREAILVLATVLKDFQREVRDDCETTNLRLENIEGHLLEQDDRLEKDTNRITRLETINKVIGGLFVAATAIIATVISKLIEGGH